MPSQEKRPTKPPDPAESRERAAPEKEPGLGRVHQTDNTPHNQADRHLAERGQAERHRELTADDTSDRRDAVDPTDPAAHAGRGQEEVDEAEATGKVRRPGQERRGGSG